MAKELQSRNSPCLGDQIVPEEKPGTSQWILIYISILPILLNCPELNICGMRLEDVINTILYILYCSCRHHKALHTKKAILTPFPMKAICGMHLSSIKYTFDICLINIPLTSSFHPLRLWYCIYLFMVSYRRSQRIIIKMFQ